MSAKTPVWLSGFRRIQGKDTMDTFRAVLLTLSVLAIGLALVLPVNDAIKQTLAIAGVIGAGVDLLLRLTA